MPELASQQVAKPASDQIRTGSARPPTGDAEAESNHGHDVHGDGGKDTHNQANNERTALHRTALPPLLVRLHASNAGRRIGRNEMPCALCSDPVGANPKA